MSSIIPRVLEPEVMDTPEEASDYDRMDHSEVNRRFASDFFSACPNPTGVILDVGTGTAQIPIEMCRQHPAVRHDRCSDDDAHYPTVATVLASASTGAPLTPS